jgi:hypothetical protein
VHKSFTRLSLATALLMGAALPVFAQGGSTPAGTAQGTPATRPAVTTAAPAANGQATAARPATPVPGATVQGNATPAQRPAATPGTATTPSRVN